MVGATVTTCLPAIPVVLSSRGGIGDIIGITPAFAREGSARRAVKE